MKFKQTKNRRFGTTHLLAGSALVALVGQASAATDLFWRGIGSAWDSSSLLRWNTNATLTGTDVLWEAGANANFQTVGGGSVDIFGELTPNGPQVDSISAASPGLGGVWTVGAWTGTTVVMVGSGSISAAVNNTLVINALVDGLAAGQGLNFAAGGGIVTVNGNIGSNIGTVTSNAPSLTLAGINSFTGDLLVQSGTTALNGGNAVTNTSGLILSNSATVTTNAAESIGNLGGSAGTTLTLGGVLTVDQTVNGSFDGAIGGTGGITKNGAAALGLNGANTYSGVTTVNDGALLIGSGSALGATGPGNGTRVNTGGTVALSGGFLTLEDFEINGPGDIAGGYGGAIHNISGSNWIRGTVTINPTDDATIYSQADWLTFDAPGTGIDGNGSGGIDTLTFDGPGHIDVHTVIGSQIEEVVKNGTGMLDITGFNNNYSGNTTITNGLVFVDNDVNLGNGTGWSGSVVFDGAAGATPTMRNTSSVDFDSADRHFEVQGPLGQIDVDLGSTVDIGNPELYFASSTNILRKLGGGTLNINTSSSGVGNTAYIDGTLDPDSGVLNVLGAGYSGVTPVAAAGCIPAAGTTTLILAGLGDANGGQSGTINLGVAGGWEFDNVIINSASSTIFNGTLNTTGDLYFRDIASPITITGAINTSGNIHIAGTQLIIASSSGLGDWALSHDTNATFVCGDTNIPAGPFAGTHSAGILSLSNDITLNERITLVNNGRLDNLSGNNTLNSELRVIFKGGLPYTSGPDDAQIGATAGTLTLVGGIFADVDPAININGLNTDTGTVIVAGQIQGPLITNVSLGNSANTTNTVQLLAANTYSGQTILNGGNLIVGNNAALSSSLVLVQASTNLDNDGSVRSLANNMMLNNWSTLTVGTNSATTLFLNGDIGGVGGITVASGGFLVLGGTNTYWGDTTVSGILHVTGTLQSNLVSVQAGGSLTTFGAERLGDGSALTVANTGAAVLGGTETVANLTVNGSLTANGNLTTITLNGSGTIAVGANTLTAQSGTFSGNLSGTNGNLVKNGGGLLTLSGDNSALTGTTTVNSGTLAAANLGSVTVDVKTGGTLTATGTFAATNINVDNGGTLNANTLIANAATVNTAGTVNVNSGPNTIANLNVNAPSGVVNLLGGDLTTGGLNGVGTINLGANTLSAASGYYEGSITGTGNVTKTGPGLLTLAGSNSFTGAANVNGGTLVAQTALNVSALNVASGATYRNVGGLLNPNVTIDNNGTVTLYGNEQASTYTSTGLLNGTGTLTAGTYNLNNGSVVGEMAAFGQVALGTGTLNSNGTVALYANSAANTANVQSGTLSIGGNLGSAGANVNISAGATLVELLNPGLGINGDIADTATVTNNGTLTLSDDELIAAYVSTGLLNGTGTLTAATYALNNGTVVAPGANLGTGTVTSNGNVLLNGGNSLANVVNVQSGVLTVNGLLGSPGADIDIDAGATLVDNGNIVDDADVNNDGTMTMNVNDLIGTYTSMGLLNGGGTLTAATYALNNGSVVSANLGTGAVTSNGTVSISGTSLANSLAVQTGTLTISNSFGSANATIGISSGARLIDNGDIVNSAAVTNAGRLTLGVNDTVGSYTSNGGLLDASPAGRTLTAATYALNNGSTVASTANIGSGSLTSNGSVTLAGNSSANTVNVASGTLTQTGSLGVAGSQITVQSGANLASSGPLTYGLLQGEGRVTRTLLTNTTTVNPGVGAGDVGILTVAGAYTESGVLGINLGGTTAGVTHDQLAVTGQVNLTAAGTLRLIQVGAYEMNRGDQALVINSPLPIIGTIGNFDISDFTRLMLFDNETGIVYGVGVNQGQDLGNLSGLTQCQAVIGSALFQDAVLPGNFVDADSPLGSTLLAVLDANNAGSALNSLSPESYVGLVDYGLNVTRAYTRAAVNGMPATVSGNTSVFVGYSHYNGGSDSSSCGGDYDLNSNGGLVGVRHKLNECWVLGGFVGIDEGTVESNYLNADSSGYVAGIFGAYTANYEHAIQLIGGVSYGSYEFDGSRSTLMGLASMNGGDTDVLDIHLGVQGDAYRNDKFRLTPTFGLHYLDASTDAINEMGPVSALSVAGMDEDAFLAEIGLTAEYKVMEKFSLLGRLSYTHNFSGGERGISASFVNGATGFGGAAAGMGEDIVSVGIGGIYNITDTISVGLNYQADFGDDSDMASSVNLGGSFSF